MTIGHQCLRVQIVLSCAIYALYWTNQWSCLKIYLHFRCYLCGKETPSGSGNVLLHLRHHHPEEHTKIVDQVARGQLQRVAGQEGQLPTEELGSVKVPTASMGSDPEESEEAPPSITMVIVKKENLQIKMEVVNNDGPDESF